MKPKRPETVKARVTRLEAQLADLLDTIYAGFAHYARRAERMTRENTKLRKRGKP